MSNSKQTVMGECLCGAVKFTLNEQVGDVGVCHCDMCRQWCGGPFMSVEAEQSNLSIQGQEFIQSYQSSEWAERAFCKQCGSNLYYFLKPAQKYYLLAGLFKDAPLNLHHQIYIDEKPTFYNFKEQTPVMTGKEVEAMFSMPE